VKKAEFFAASAAVLAAEKFSRDERTVNQLFEL
jgi:hypothetical protein